MGRAMFSKCSIQFSVDGQSFVPSLLLDLRPNYSGGKEDNVDLHQKVPGIPCCTQCLRPCSRPLPTHAATGDFWTLMGMSGSVSCGVTAPFSWVLVCTRLYVLLVKAMFFFPVVMYGCESWTIKKAEHRRIDAFEL